MRKYESGTKSCFWRWTHVVLNGAIYLVRLHLFKLDFGGRLGCALMLHWFYGPDPQRDPHDHPIPFLSIVLRGGYTEWRPWNPRHRVRWFNLLRATDVHKILDVEPGTLTLVLAGPKVREWGFHTAEGWVSWRDYPKTGEKT